MERVCRHTEQIDFNEIDPGKNVSLSHVEIGLTIMTCFIGRSEEFDHRHHIEGLPITDCQV